MTRLFVGPPRLHRVCQTSTQREGKSQINFISRYKRYIYQTRCRILPYTLIPPFPAISYKRPHAFRNMGFDRQSPFHSRLASRGSTSVTVDTGQRTMSCLISEFLKGATVKNFWIMRKICVFECEKPKFTHFYIFGVFFLSFFGVLCHSVCTRKVVQQKFWLCKMNCLRY